MRAEHKDQVRSEVTARVVGRLLESEERLETVLTDTLYLERLRLEKGTRYPGEGKDAAFWSQAARQLQTGSHQTRTGLVKQVVERFVDEVMGHFDPRVYSMATRVLPTGLGMLLNSLNPRRVLKKKGEVSLNLQENVIVKGESEAARRLAHQGTLVVVPTHLSNLDSIVMGYTAFLMGLPPLTYGAGLNLFTNKLIGYFMSNLGAYRVDRRKKCGLYKEVLKEYATFSIELGYHNLFFPGGTRIRSGGVERKLKKGLLGTGLRAYVNNLHAGRRRPNVYYVPATISYGLVLEAKTLVEDHLKELGKSRYIITDDEFSRPRRIAQFMKELLELNSKIYITFGQPLDPFGNRVDFQGRSLDGRDRPVDITRYVCRNGEVVEDAQRDREYTSELTGSIVRAYETNNRLQATHLVGFTLFRLMRDAAPERDLYRTLRVGTGPVGLPIGQVTEALARVLREVRRRVDASELMLDPRLDGRNAEEVLGFALGYFRSYHQKNAVRRDAGRIHSDDAQLCYYYHNRMEGYGLERFVSAA